MKFRHAVLEKILKVYFKNLDQEQIKSYVSRLGEWEGETVELSPSEFIKVFTNCFVANEATNKDEVLETVLLKGFNYALSRACQRFGILETVADLLGQPQPQPQPQPEEGK